MSSKQKIIVSETTGLTPTQERACTLLASGESVTSVAEKLDVTRATIYTWQKQVTFKCYFNKQCSDSRSVLELGLFGMANEALQAIRESLNSENEQIRLKAATWIADKLKDVKIGETDVIEAVRAEATHTNNDLLDWGDTTTFDEEEYSSKLKELGVKEQSYQSTLK